MKMIKTILTATVITTIFTLSLHAQERNDVIQSYNEGAKLMKTDIEGAIKAFENVVTLSDKVGETANDLKENAIKVLPGLYIKAASAAVSGKKSGAEIVDAAKTAIAAAEKYGSKTSEENARKVLVQGYYKMGVDFFTAKDYDNALLAFDSLLMINPDYTSAIYNKALVYRTQNNVAAFEETIDLFLEKVKGENNAERTKQASELALEYFRAAGSQANQADKLDEAIELLNKAAKYGEDKDLFYYFADVYNKQKKFDNAAEYAQKGLVLETGDVEAKAKFYFQLGIAQAGKGETANACDSFKNALYGPFAAPSKAERTNLKCQ